MSTESTIKWQIGTYVAMKPSSDSAAAIVQFCNEHGINEPIPASMLHTTILYSRKECKNIRSLGNIFIPLIAQPLNFDIWQDRSTPDTNMLVLILSCEDMVTRHNFLRLLHNATHDYDNFIPHITLSYDAGNILIDNLPKFNQPIIFDFEYSEPLQL